MTAQIRFHNGTPTLFLDGKPVFGGILAGGLPERDPSAYPYGEIAKYYAAAGVHIYSSEFSQDAPHADWGGPRPGVNTFISQ